MKALFTSLFIAVGLAAFGRNITGPTTVNVGETHTYTFSNGTIYPFQNWVCANGSVISKWSSGSTYYASIQFTAAGATTVRFLDQSYIQRGSLNVTVNVAVPTTTFSTSQSCGVSTITRNTNPPSGITWYWQTSASGTSTTYSGTTYDVYATATYYLRARSGTTWSTAAQSTGSVTVPVSPGTPGSGTDGHVISNSPAQVPVSVGSVSGATSYKWYSAASGGTVYASTTVSNLSQTLSATRTYYAAAIIGSCESPTRRQVTASLHPEPILSATNNGLINLGGSVVLSVSNYTYDTYQWLDADGNAISGATSSTYNTSVPGDYRVRVTKGSSDDFTSPPVKICGLNYIKVSDILVTGATTESAANSLAIGSRAETVQYFDGLGRVKQTVVTKGSPLLKDMVQPTVYDTYGREYRKYLPYVSTENTGAYKDQSALFDGNGNYTHNFYNNSSGDVAVDTRPFSKVEYDDSPLGKVLKTFGPGQDWHTNNKYAEVKDLVVEYGTSAGMDKVIVWTITAGIPAVNTAANGGYYPTGSLLVTSAKDEEGHEVRMYKDREGRMILRMVHLAGSTTDLTSAASAANWSRTYYVYDELSNLRFVLQPELIKKVVETGYVVVTTDIPLYIFSNLYDERQRLVERKVPGGGTIYYVYDKRDRLVLTQDSNQRNISPTKQWLYTKYDAQNRVIATGVYASNNSRATMQAYVTTNAGGTFTWGEKYIGSQAGNVDGYTNTAFPNTGIAAYHAVSYFDSYDTYNAPAAYAYLNESLTDPETSIAQRTAEHRIVTGLPVASKVKNLGSGQWLQSVVYYDDKGRTIQTMGDHQKGTNRQSMVIDFPGRVLLMKTNQVVNTVPAYTRERFKYDHASRVLWVKHSVNGSSDVTTVTNKYNELGQPVDKKLHSTDGTTFMQSVDYAYNIRGWTTRINQADVGPVAAGDAGVDFFGMELAYNNTLADLTSTALYNGNITAIKWSKGYGGNVRQQAYAFVYDNMNRMTGANHFDREFDVAQQVWEWNSNNNGFGENVTYDLNGNIKTLIRKGFKGNSMDNLTYYYTGNQLTHVNDAADPLVGFVNGNTGTDDYGYDYNGNLYRDKNKGIANSGDIKYNHLNLPTEIIKGSEKVKYIYDAAGMKLAQEVYNTSGVLVTTTDYIGAQLFENNVLKQIQHSDGRVLPDGGGWEYQYHLKDHLGNVRVTFTAKAQVATSYTTDFESGSSADFLNYTNTTFDLVDHTDAAGTVYQKVQWLNGGTSGRVGVAKSVPVMPGDEISITAYGKYMNLGGTSNATAFVTALASAFGVSSGSTGEQLKIYNGLSSYASTVAGGDHTGDDEGAPKAFVTILFFDKDYNLLDAAWDQMTTTGAQGSATVKEPPHDVLSITAKAPDVGYAYVFVSNEHPTWVDVYFDDVTVSTTPSPIVSASDYFPYGLGYNQMDRSGSQEQRTLYNGKELQDELSLNWYDYGARMYMPELGRWGVVDPMAEVTYSWSAYHYAFNNPVKYIDPNGMMSDTFMESDLYWGFASLVFCNECGFIPNQSGKGNQEGQAPDKQGKSLSSLLNDASEAVNTDDEPRYEEDLKDQTQGNGSGVYVIGGANVDMMGISQTTTDIANAVGANGVYTFSPYFDDNDKVVAQIVGDIKKGYTAGQKILLYGYSKGGDLALQVSRQLNAANINVALLVTIDPAYGWASDEINRTVPGNVNLTYNFYQTTAGAIIPSYGGPNSGPGLIWNFNVTAPNISHSNIDEATKNMAILLMNINK